MEHRNLPENVDDQPPGNVNDLFDYDVGVDELLQEPSRNSSAIAPEASGLKLGLDDEVKVTRKRQPVAKLDDNRLLSPAGIPKLRRTANQRLRFKGKGHEFSDAARLLNFYQLWLDDLFPRAKFADGLAIIEKLGHTKRLQSMRRAWIEEEKPQPLADGEQKGPFSSISELCKSKHLHSSGDGHQQSALNHSTLHETRATESDMHAQISRPRNHIEQIFASPNGDASLFLNPDTPDDDELEALLNGDNT